MKNLYNINGLIFWNENEIDLRDFFIKSFYLEIKQLLISINPAFRFARIEGTILTPQNFINKNYTDKDIYKDNDIALRPETTASSYLYAEYLLKNKYRMPLCVWQSGKSFRKEQDKTLSNMRLKEFYQQEFQIIYSKNTLCNYHEKILNPLKDIFSKYLKIDTRIVKSDRLPNYSTLTNDVEVFYNGKWIELCSISNRTDFKDANVLEIAIGLDRCVMVF